MNCFGSFIAVLLNFHDYTNVASWSEFASFVATHLVAALVTKAAFPTYIDLLSTKHRVLVFYRLR